MGEKSELGMYIFSASLRHKVTGSVARLTAGLSLQSNSVSVKTGGKGRGEIAVKYSTWQPFPDNAVTRKKYASIYSILQRRCGGLVVRVLSSRSPVPGSNLGPGPPHSMV